MGKHFFRDKRFINVSKDFYDRVMKIINKEKNDDDKYYNQAFLYARSKTDVRQVRIKYDFETKQMEIGHGVIMTPVVITPEEAGYQSYTGNWEYAVNYDSLKNLSDLKYGFSKTFSYEEFDEEEVKKEIDEVLTGLYGLEVIYYDKKETHQDDNVKDELLSFMRAYDYEYGNKVKQNLCLNTYPSVSKLVDLICKKVRKVYKEKLKAENNLEAYDNYDILQFGRILNKKIMDFFPSSGYPVYVGFGIIDNALEESNLNINHVSLGYDYRVSASTVEQTKTGLDKWEVWSKQDYALKPEQAEAINKVISSRVGFSRFNNKTLY